MFDDGIAILVRTARILPMRTAGRYRKSPFAEFRAVQIGLLMH